MRVEMGTCSHAKQEGDSYSSGKKGGSKLSAHHADKIHHKKIRREIIFPTSHLISFFFFFLIYIQCIFIKVPILEFIIIITCIFLGFFICIPAYVVN
jgi:hypothetical protein